MKILSKLTRKNIFQNIILIIFIILIRTTVLGNYSVPTGSMNPTILEGDKFFANNLAYSLKVPFSKKHLLRWSIPHRGDIVAFYYPLNDKLQFTKRVIGVPGDTIKISGHSLYINGKKIAASALSHDNMHSFYMEKLADKKYVVQYLNDNNNFFNAKESNNKKYKVPAGHIFVMGDNRDNSSDSRVWGFVPLDNVTGKIIFRWMSIKPNTYDFRLNRIGTIE